MAETCGKCHADRALVERRHIPVPRAYQLYQQSVHGRAVAADKAGASCNDCHESHNLRRANDPTSSIYRENIPKTCAKCHADESRQYAESIHGVAMAQGATKSPVCTDCHGEHSIRAPRDPASRVSVASVSKTCANCHEAEGISQKYDIPGERLTTYADSFHGLAVRLQTCQVLAFRIFRGVSYPTEYIFPPHAGHGSGCLFSLITITVILHLRAA